MAWTKPEFGRNRIVNAGKVLAGRKQCSPEEWQKSFDTAVNWRSSHTYPLQVMYMTLRNRAQKLDPEMIVAQRLKRLPSIVKKLELFKNMQLSQMQDLGGCRAVVGHIEQVDHLVKTYKSNPPPTAKPAKIDDYVTKPKEDGYRSVHLVS